jgi:hypothetical protein
MPQIKLGSDVDSPHGRVTFLDHHFEEPSMKNARLYFRWFICGIGNVIGISHSLPPAENTISVMDAIGGDFRAAGNDLRNVMQRYPARPETARELQSAQQLELAGIN